MNYNNKIRLFIFILIAFITGAFIYFSASKRKLHITGFALKGDQVTVTINGKKYAVENNRSADKPKLNYLYEEAEYRSLKRNDLIYIKSDSNKFRLLDTIIVLNNSNVKPRVFFENPFLTNSIRKVYLVNDSGLMDY